MPFNIVRQDITKLKVDAIVNAANINLQMGGGVCGAIFNAAGAKQLQKACDKLAPIKTGEAVITPGFNLSAKFIIHAAGPIYRQCEAEKSEMLLGLAYTNSLRLAVENKCKSIAFPLISSGIYGYPKDEAMQVATSAIRIFLADHDLDVYLVVFDNASYAISKELLGEVECYIDEHYISEHKSFRCELLDIDLDELEEKEIISYNTLPPMDTQVYIESIDDLVRKLDEPFSNTLLRLIVNKGKTDVEVYKRSKELSLEETDDLLQRAGYALSHSQMFDVIIEYFIVSRKYDIFEINEVLFKYDQPLLGG